MQFSFFLKILINIKQSCSSEMFLRFVLLGVPHRTSENFKIIAVINIHITAIFKLQIIF